MHVEVGGETIPIRGARFVLQDDMVRLELSSSGSNCGRMGFGSDVEVEVRHYGRGPTPRQAEIYVSGHRVFVDRALSFGSGTQDRITFMYDRTLTPGTRVLTEVSFAGDTRGLPVLVRGHVRAIVCPPI